MSGTLEGLLVGRRLADRYDVEEPIGRGGMSIVYRAVDRRLERQVALKVVSIPADAAAERASLRERLRREAASAARLSSHPHVVQVYDYGTDAELDLDFIAMELLRGRDLKDALQRGPITPDVALRVLREAASGLAAGHREGIVHRDVKPANIFLTGHGPSARVKILDFGIAKALEHAHDDDLTRTGQLPHSPAYASPEQLRADGPLTPASDVYQLGLVGYELLSGERPFAADERERLADEDLDLPRRGRWHEVPQPLRDVLSRALRPSPGDRFADAAAFAEALERAEGAGVAETGADEDLTLLAPMSGAGVDPSVPQPVDRDFSPSERPRVHTAVSRRVMQAAGIAVLAVGALWLATRGEDQSTEPPAVAVAGPVALDELAAEFRELQLAAVENLRESTSGEQGEAAAVAVRQVIADLNEAWVRGEMDRHLSHYAERVDFYSAENAPASRIREERARDLERYPEREITIERTAVTFPEAGEARALVDKSWEFGGGEAETRTGCGRQELVLELSGGAWKVVSEQLLEEFC